MQPLTEPILQMPGSSVYMAAELRAGARGGMLARQFVIGGRIADGRTEHVEEAKGIESAQN